MRRFHTGRVMFYLEQFGTSYQGFSLIARAVEAYEQAIAQKETLAMANIAYLYMARDFFVRREIT